MTQINEKVDVYIVNDSPKMVKWKDRILKIEKIGLHHTFFEGKTLIHIFSVATSTLFLRLRFDTSILSWVLEEVSNAV